LCVPSLFGKLSMVAPQVDRSGSVGSNLDSSWLLVVAAYGLHMPCTARLAPAIQPAAVCVPGHQRQRSRAGSLIHHEQAWQVDAALAGTACSAQFSALASLHVPALQWQPCSSLSSRAARSLCLGASSSSWRDASSSWRDASSSWRDASSAASDDGQPALERCAALPTLLLCGTPVCGYTGLA
jgi:hypothetical protein